MLCGLRRAATALAAAPPTAGQVRLYRFDHWFQSNRVCTAVSNYHEPSWGSVHQVMARSIRHRTAAGDPEPSGGAAPQVEVSLFHCHRVPPLTGTERPGVLFSG